MDLKIIAVFFVYVIYSEAFGKFYVGLSENVGERLKEHNLGRTKSTRPYIPWHTVHTEEFADRMAARQREKYLKSAAGRRWRKKQFLIWGISSAG